MSVCVDCGRPMDKFKAQTSLVCEGCAGRGRATDKPRQNWVRRVHARGSEYAGRRARSVDTLSGAPEGCEQTGEG